MSPRFVDEIPEYPFETFLFNVLLFLYIF